MLVTLFIIYGIKTVANETTSIFNGRVFAQLAYIASSSVVPKRPITNLSISRISVVVTKYIPIGKVYLITGANFSLLKDINFTLNLIFPNIYLNTINCATSSNTKQPKTTERLSKILTEIHKSTTFKTDMIKFLIAISLAFPLDTNNT